MFVDANLGSGSVSRVFRMSVGQVGCAEALERAVPAVPVKGGVLHVSTAGSIGPERAETALHFSGRSADTFESAYDLVVLDTPPVNIVIDSTIIATAADAVLIVVRSVFTRPEALDLVLQRLRRVNRNLVAVVPNDTKTPTYESTYYATT